MIEEDDASTGSDPEKPSTWRGLAWFLLVLLLCAHAVLNGWWLMEDNHAIRTDEEGHMLKARMYYEALYGDASATLMERLIASTQVPIGNPAHPPVLHLLGATAVALFGYSPDVLAAVGTGAFLLAIVGTFLLAGTFLPPLQALFAALVFSLVPVAYSASRFFMTDYLAMTMVVWAVYMLVRSGWYMHTGWVFGFAILNGLAILTRIIAPLYYAAPLAVIAIGGIFVALRSAFGTPRCFQNLRTLLLNYAMTVVVTLSICGWWYLDNLEDLNRFWTEIHSNKSGVTVFHADDAEAEPPTAAPRTAAPTTPPVAALEPVPIWESNPILRAMVSPSLGWSRYPTHVINNNAFLILSILGVLGLLLVPMAGRFRRLEGWTLVLWLLGAWFCLTVLLKFGNPRYAIPAMPALGLLAALPVVLVPWRGVRAGLGILLTGILVFQYVNLSIRSFGSYYAPLKADSAALKRFNDEGLAVFKDTLSLSYSYSRLGPPIQENYKETIHLAMVQAEREHPLPIGEDAYYVRLGYRGGEFYDKHYWPEPNPFRDQKVPVTELPRRRLRDLALTYRLDQMDLVLDKADYVVYALYEHEAEKEAEYKDYFSERGFLPAARVTVAQSGAGFGRIFGVFARNFPAMISAMPLDELEQFRKQPEYRQLREDVFELAERRYQERVDPHGVRLPLTESVSFVSLEVAPQSRPFTYQAAIILKVEKPVVEDYEIALSGIPLDSTEWSGPVEVYRGPENDWSFAPASPSSTWIVGDYVRIVQELRTEPGSYAVQIGLRNQAGMVDGFPVTIPEIAFQDGRVLREEAAAP